MQEVAATSESGVFVEEVASCDLLSGRRSTGDKEVSVREGVQAVRPSKTSA